MTKRRPLWSKRLRQAAALACGLLLLNVAPSLAAAGKKSAAKPVAGKSAKRPVRKPPPPRVEIGAAEIIESDTTGLHGSASFYGSGFQGRKTSTGERFDVRQFTAATNHFPLGSMLAVRRLDNDRCAIVKVNDRMHTKHRRRVIDVSRSVAEYLDMVRAGVVLVRVAPMKPDWRGQGELACHSAFEPEVLCDACGQPPRLPGFPGDS